MKKFILPILILLSVSAHAQTVAIRHGGTGKTTRQGAIDTLSNVTQATEGMALTDSSGHAVWSTAGAISTPVSIANGGTNATSFTTNAVIYKGASALAATAAGTNNQILIGNTSGAPSWSTLNSLLIVLSDTTGQTGKKLTVKAGGGFDWE